MTRKEWTVLKLLATHLIAATTTLAATTLHAQEKPAATEQASPTVIRNSGFEGGKVGDPIEGWHARDANGFLSRISDDEPKSGKQCGRLQRQGDTKSESRFGTLNHTVDATPFRGTRVRFRAAVRTVVQGEGNEARLWFRVDRISKNGNRSVGAFDNMHNRPIRATEWKYYDIVGDVAPDARVIVLGLMLMGHGEVFIDDVSFEVVGNDVALTAKALPSVARSTRPRGTPIEQIGPGLFEVSGEMEVRPTSTWPTDGSGEASLLLPLPLSYRDQVPLAYHLSADPPESLKSVSIYEDQPHNFVAKVVLSDLAKHRKVDVKFRSPVLVAPSAFDNVPKSATIPALWPPESQVWLASTWCVEADHERIQAIAKEIRDETDDVLQVIGHVEQKAKSIFRAAEGRLQNLTAVEALDKRGSCTSCGNLVAALLRACDVPARVLSGYPAWSGPLQTHYIVEAYVPTYGWYPVESTLCRSPWPNSHQVNVSIIPPEHEAQRLAGRRRSAAGGVPYLSLTEADGSGMFYARGTIKDAPGCDHQCKMIRRFDSDGAQWTQAMQWAKPRWENWVRSAPSAENDQLSFGPTADEIESKSAHALVDELSHGAAIE